LLYAPVASRFDRPSCEPDAQRTIIIDLHPTLSLTAAIIGPPMGKFDHIWHDLKPKAIRLREEGLTPQQTCTELAWTEFKDKLVNPVP
jgi:hypothetical protein